MEDSLRTIIQEAVFAPSGENCQPWRFVIKGRDLLVFNIPDRDQSLYNFEQRGSLVAHGALLENIDIISSKLGMKTEVILFPDAQDQNCVARISFHKADGGGAPLYPYIAKRVTNRKPYSKEPLDMTHREELLRATETMRGGVFRIVSDAAAKGKIARVASLNEQLIFENRSLHRFFFSHLNWTSEENKKRSVGFFVETLELTPQALGAMKIFRHWPILNIANKIIKVSESVAEENRKRYQTSAAFGVISIFGNSKQDFVFAGRMMQRVWLTATKLNIALQPVTGVLFFMQRIASGSTEGFSSKEVARIRAAYADIAGAFGMQGEKIIFMSRFGYAEPPSAHSSRLLPEIITTL